MHITPEVLSELERMDKEAKQGVWKQGGCSGRMIKLGKNYDIADVDNKLNSDLIIAMRNNLPALLAAAREKDEWQQHAATNAEVVHLLRRAYEDLKAKLAVAVEALKWIQESNRILCANEHTDEPYVTLFRQSKKQGEVATEAIAKIGESV